MFKRFSKGVIKRLSANVRTILMLLGIVLVSTSLFITNRMANSLREKERHDVELWAAAMERINRDAMGDYMGDPLVASIISNRNNIPFIITDENLRVVSYHLIPDTIINNPELLRRTLDKMSADNTPIVVHFWWTNEHNHIIFYGQSSTLYTLYLFPYIQMAVIIAFVLLLFV
ncbi:MAG: sensor histidine kinase, partial [Alistipes sp.]|nr:sensor histidine kinase [Alistipes sp.]